MANHEKAGCNDLLLCYSIFMEEEKTRTEKVKEDTKDLVGHVTDLLESYSKLVIVNATQKAIDISSSIIFSVTLALLCFLVAFFIGLGLAWWLGNVINSRAGGFFIVGGIYLLSMIILMAMRKKTIFPFLRNFLTRKIYE